MGMTEEEARKFTELQEGMKALTDRLSQETEARKAAEASADESRKVAEVQAKEATEKVTGMEAAVKAAEEQVAGLRRASYRKELEDFVRSNRLAFQGEVPEAVARLEVLSTKLSEQEFAEYKAEKGMWHTQMKDSVLLNEVGRPGSGNTGIQAQIDSLVEKAMSDNSALSKPQAVEKVLKANPKLYKEYDLAQRGRKGGV